MSKIKRKVGRPKKATEYVDGAVAATETAQAKMAKARGKKLSALNCHDFLTARMCSDAYEIMIMSYNDVPAGHVKEAEIPYYLVNYKKLKGWIVEGPKKD